MDNYMDNSEKRQNIDFNGRLMWQLSDEVCQYGMGGESTRIAEHLWGRNIFQWKFPRMYEGEPNEN